MIERRNLLVCGWAVGFLASPAHPWGVIPNYDFDWATISDLGNAPYEGGPIGQLAGRQQWGAGHPAIGVQRPNCRRPVRSGIPTEQDAC